MGWSAFHISIASVLAEAAASFNRLAEGGGFTLTQTQRNYIALGIAGVCVTYLLFRSKFRRKPDPLGRSSSPAGTGLAQQRAVERQMQQLLVELSEMARQISGQLDTRAARFVSRRPDAEYPVWSCVHGMAVLVTRGPLRDMPEDFVRHVGGQLFAFITRGL